MTMINMKQAHKAARFTTSFNGKTYRQNLADAMRILWGEFKKAALSVETAIKTLSKEKIFDALYALARFNGYSIENAYGHAKFNSDNQLHIEKALIHAGYNKTF